ncbi:hypothetical protein PDQ75_24880 [Bacillus cereus group sp. Bc015]|uniref:hypothetical protein n=1 Tax=Bacillus cereus group sp. Bc015 TaxID=3018123 RepID=UPI0022E48CEF|nr:hypothetical protein [Bacillus cereus group sp. Bc015]MDA2738391.1 hypothetical protein [Bacillus cereus group sp. Bc015]
MDVKTFRDNLFQMNTRRFGKVMELAIKNLTKTHDPANIHHDLNTDTGTRIEVKFSRVEKNHKIPVTDTNVLDVIENEGLLVRLFPFGEWQQHKFDCNIQQLKKDEFDVLFYGMLFADRIVIFMATPDQIDNNMKYSNKQHKGNEGEGQFHINPSTLQYHLDKHHYVTLSYADLLKVLGR